MASIKTRGPKNARRYYVAFDVGRTPEGRRIQRMHLLKGATNLADARQELARVEREVVASRDPFAPVVKEQVGPLLDRWQESLTNRSAADDRSRIRNHLQPKLKAMTIDAVTLPVVMKWVDELANTDLSPQSQRHMLNLLSRFFSWCIERGMATVNPVKMVPQGRRPVAVKTEDAPWLDDPKKVQELIAALGPEVGLMFYLANGSGMRLGEACGLRDWRPRLLGRGCHPGGAQLRWAAEGRPARRRQGEMGAGPARCRGEGEGAVGQATTPGRSWR